MTSQALVRRTSNGNDITVPPTPVPKPTAPLPPLTEEYVNALLAGRGTRGWLRAANVARVLGLLSLYLFLDTYDVRADFNRRTINRLREQAKSGNRCQRLKAWLRSFAYEAFDRFIRVLRYVVFRGAEGSARKDARLEKQAIWLRDRLINLGPTFIKIGQALGTRADLLPLPYVKELAILHDRVPAFPTADAFARIESELGRPVHEAYAEIDSEPIASASLGQVYRARLATGEEVAVKVQRPNLAETISIDVAILYRLVKLTNRFFPKANENADWEGMLHEFYATVFDELDYIKEGRNADRFRYNFRTWRAVRVPKVFWSHTNTRVLTLEFVRGTKVVDIEGLKARRI